MIGNWLASWFAFEQVVCGGVEIGIRKDARVAGIIGVGGRMSFVDAFLLARELKCVEEERDAENAESG